MVLLATVALSMLALFISLVTSAVVAKHEAVATTLATNQIEYLKSLPYDSLAVAGGQIYSTTYLPATATKTLNGTTYTVTTAINYVDDAYDGCASGINTFPLAQRPTYCRNYPPPTNVPDTSPYDYKILDVTVTSRGGAHLAELSTQVSARVAESGSTKGALFAKVIETTGSPVAGAHVTLVDANLGVSLGGDSDENGVVPFYDLPPDTTGYHYVMTASLAGYSTLKTIAPSGALQPTYSSQNIVAQQSSFATLTIKPQGANSLLVEATDPNGTALSGAKIYIKGGYKNYTATTDTTYYYDNMQSGDSRPVTDASGLVGISSLVSGSTSLVPGNYIFCGDTGATSCVNGSGSALYVAAAIPYSGTTVFNPITVPIEPNTPANTTYTYNSLNYIQKVRLILTTSSTFPRINTITPYDVSLASGATNFAFTVNGTNLSGGTVKFLQGASTFIATCSGSSSQLSCTVDISAATAGNTQMVLTAGGNTLTIPSSLMLGGLIVTP